MFGNAEKNAMLFVIAAVVLFLIGGLLTTLVPPLIDTSWGRGADDTDAVKSSRRYRSQRRLKALKGWQWWQMKGRRKYGKHYRHLFKEVRRRKAAARRRGKG